MGSDCSTRARTAAVAGVVSHLLRGPGRRAGSTDRRMAFAVVYRLV